MSGEGDARQKDIITVLFPFFFLHKNSPFIQVFSSTSTLERSFIIFFWAQKKKKSDEGGTDRLSTSAVRIDLFNYFINSYVTSITYTEIQRNTRGRRWGPTQGPVTHAPPWVSQNQTVKCTLLLSINREATLKKKKKNTMVKGCWNQEKKKKGKKRN